MGTLGILVRKSSGWEIVAIGLLACMGPNRVSNYTIKFWLMYGNLYKETTNFYLRSDNRLLHVSKYNMYNNITYHGGPL